MTAQEYKDAGFDISTNLSQAKIDAAEDICRQAYITPITKGVEDESTADVVNKLLMSSAFLYLLRSRVFATRSGAKIKMTAQSENIAEWQTVSQMCTTCALYIDELRAAAANVDGMNCDAKIYDVNKIYFKSNYFGL